MASLGMTTINIAIPNAMRVHVANRVDSGEFGNTSKCIRDLIRKDQLDQQKARLRSLLEDGLASGPATKDSDDDRNELRALARGRARSAA